jgi:integrase/recombinase XerC
MSAPETERALGEAERAVVEFFLARASKKDAPGTIEAYQRDLQQVLSEVAHVLGTSRDKLTVAEIAQLRTLRAAFGAWSTTRAGETVRRAHSSWSEFFKFLVSEEMVAGSPMPGIPRPKAAERVPRAFAAEDEQRIVATALGGEIKRRDPWPELDAAVILTLLITGARLSEMLGMSVGDVTRAPGSERVRVLGKGGKERVIPVEPVIVDALGIYLDSRRARFPAGARTRGVGADASAWDWWSPNAPLLVGRDGERMKRGALQYLVKLVYISAGVDGTRAPGALVHALRHTVATRLAEEGATGTELMAFLGHRSLSTTQRYLSATGAAIRSAAQRNPVYQQLAERDADGQPDESEEA